MTSQIISEVLKEFITNNSSMISTISTWCVDEIGSKLYDEEQDTITTFYKAFRNYIYKTKSIEAQYLFNRIQNDVKKRLLKEIGFQNSQIMKRKIVINQIEFFIDFDSTMISTFNKELGIQYQTFYNSDVKFVKYLFYSKEALGKEGVYINLHRKYNIQIIKYGKILYEYIMTRPNIIDKPTVCETCYEILDTESIQYYKCKKCYCIYCEDCDTCVCEYKFGEYLLWLYSVHNTVGHKLKMFQLEEEEYKGIISIERIDFENDIDIIVFYFEKLAQKEGKDKIPLFETYNYLYSNEARLLVKEILALNRYDNINTNVNSSTTLLVETFEEINTAVLSLICDKYNLEFKKQKFESIEILKKEEIETITQEVMPFNQEIEQKWTVAKKEIDEKKTEGKKELTLKEKEEKRKIKEKRREELKSFEIDGQKYLAEDIKSINWKEIVLNMRKIQIMN